MLDHEFARNAQSLMKDVESDLGEIVEFEMVVTEVFDELATDQSWSALKETNLRLMSGIKSSKGAAIVATAKDEGVNILEWIAHHKAIGFEHIFIYTNDNRDGSKNLYELLARNGVITYIQNKTGPNASPQVKAYEHSIHFLRELRQFEWVAYFDIDELLIPSELYDHSIRNLLVTLKQTHSENIPGAVCFNWDWYGSEEAILRGPGLVQDRFKYSTPHPLVKSIVRLPHVKSMRCVHIPELLNSYTVDSAFRAVDMSSYRIESPSFHGGKINHYDQKSFEEFCIKCDRGEGSSAGGSTGKDVGTFFWWDIEAVPEKLTLIPCVLRQRTQLELAKLLSINGIEDVQANLEEKYRELLHTVNGTKTLEKYNELKKCCQPDRWYRNIKADFANHAI